MHLKSNLEEVISVKKIQKVNHTTAQSVYSFACPCNGHCSTVCICTTPDSKSSNSQNSMNANNPHRTTGV